jgi:hypothetical protein
VRNRREALRSTPLGAVKSENEQIRQLALGMMVAGVCVAAFTSLTAIRTGYYGRYTSEASIVWGVHINARVAWFLQESPNLFMAAANVALGDSDCLHSSVNQILLGLFCMHYANRTLVYPFLIRRGAPVPIGTCLLATLFCTVNGCAPLLGRCPASGAVSAPPQGPLRTKRAAPKDSHRGRYMQTRALTKLAVYDEGWFTSPLFGAGVTLFFAGAPAPLDCPQAHAAPRGVHAPSRTNWTRLVPPPVLTGHVSSLLPY